MFGLNLALQYHLCMRQEQGRSYGGTVLCGGLLLKVLVFISMKHLIDE